MPDAASEAVPEPIWLHPSCWMEALSAGRRRALFTGAIPNSFHYETPRQSQLWQAVARAYAPDLEAVYREIFEPALDWAADGGPIHVIGLGTGGARKEAWLLENLFGARFTPVDVSASLALISAQHVRPLVPEAPRPLVADLLQFADLPAWLNRWDGGQPRRLYTAFGLTPNSLPSELLPVLRAYLRPRDRLLISANLLPDGDLERVRPEYDNAETKTWISQILIDWGLREKLTEPVFHGAELESQAALLAEATWKENVRFSWEGEEFCAEVGEVLKLFFSIRFTPERFEKVLNGFGLQAHARAIGACGREGIWLISR